MWVIPPEQHAAFVANMEDILELYAESYDPRWPVVCMDEQPVQLVKETRLPIPAAPGRDRRVDFEYERNGTANIFVFTEPLAGHRTLSVRERKTGRDWCDEIKALVARYPHAEKIRLVCDNLNTHALHRLYDVFPPAEARLLSRKIEMRHTPKHGSWLNVAECELSVFTRQALGERCGDMATLSERATAWSAERNARQSGVRWHFTTAQARIKLLRLYPQIQLN